MIPKKIVLILLLIFVVGCDIGSHNGITFYDPYHGSEGLVISWLENMPPEEIYEEKPFMVGVRVENMGATNIKNGVLILTHTKTDMSVENVKRTISLEGKSTTRQFGDRDAIFWDATTALIGGKKYSTDIGVEACYNYETNMVEDVCIDPDKHSQKVEEKTCTTPDEISLKNQGAPIAVTSIKPVIIPNDAESGEVWFILTIENVGGGYFSDSTPENLCGSEAEGLNFIRVEAWLSNKPASCESKRAMMEENIATVKCEIPYNANSEYMTPLHVKLSYVYKSLLPPVSVPIKES